MYIVYIKMNIQTSDIKAKRGRPAGSKNKKKVAPEEINNAPDGSSVAPVGVGNTSTPPYRDNGKKHWIITLKVENKYNGSNGSNFNKWFQTHTSEAVWQVEQGEETGYIHYQMTFKLKFKNRFSWLKNHFHAQAHCEVVNNHDAAFDYCQKSDTRLHGPFYWPEKVQDGVPDPLDNCELYKWQEDIVEIFRGPVNPRTIYWYWEPDGNVGKSDFCLHCILNHDAVVYDSGKKDILFAHKNQTKVIFDLSRTQEGYVSYDAMESLKKGFCFSGKYESGMKVFPKPHIVVFANWEPDTSKLSMDRWCIRRIR